MQIQINEAESLPIVRRVSFIINIFGILVLLVHGALFWQFRTLDPCTAVAVSEMQIGENAAREGAGLLIGIFGGNRVIRAELSTIGCYQRSMQIFFREIVDSK